MRPSGPRMVLGWVATEHERRNLLRWRIFWGIGTVLVATHKQSPRSHEKGERGKKEQRAIGRAGTARL